MPLSSHIATIESKHAQVDIMLSEEYARPHPDAVKVMDLKKLKLLYKEERERLLRMVQETRRNAS